MRNELPDVLLLMVVLSISLTILISCIGCGSRDAPVNIDYIVESGYVGWVEIQFDDPNCQPPARKIPFGEAIRVGSEGRACSTAPAPKGHFVSWYYADAAGEAGRELESTGWGEGGMVWAKTSSEATNSQGFFIGTEDQLERSWSRQGEPGDLREWLEE